ncbi:efflux RND transporter periplasmic adaptor subunit [Magnetospira thiophila]
MKQSYVIAAALTLVVAVWIGSGLGASEEEPTPPEMAAAPVEASPFKVRVRESQARDWHRKLSLFGHTEAERSVEIRTETDGRVEMVEVDKGASVEAGQVLVRLVADNRKARLAEARALLTQRQLEFEAAQELADKNFRSKTKLAEARAALESARAALDLAQLELERITIAAPFAGIVDSRRAEVGSYLKTGDVVATLVDTDPLRVVGEIPEAQAVDLHLGAPATAQLADGQTVEGVLHYLAVTADTKTRTFRFEVDVPNPDARLRAGLTARLILDTGVVRAHLISPALLTLSDEGQVGLRGVDADGTVVFHPVKIIDDTQDGMWVGGLPERLRLIIVGQEFVKAGQTVEPVAGDAP